LKLRPFKNEPTQNLERTTIVQTHTQQASKQHTKQTQIIKNSKGHPFTDEIVEAQLPPKWKGLNIKLYHSSTNLDEHMNVYKTQMNLYTRNKVVWYKVFPTSLKQGAFNWFTQFPSNLVDSLKALAAKFSTQYVTSRRHHMSSLALLNVKKKRNLYGHSWK